MTREEAIEWLGRIKDRYIHGGDEGFDNKRKEAIDMAIEALQAEPVKHGEWIEAEWIDLNDWTTWRECSCCGESLSKYVEGFGRRDFPQMNYCPNCGAKMDKE